MMALPSRDPVLEADPAVLLEESGSLARAAWRLVRARCGPDMVPTREQLRTVSREIAARCGYDDVSPSLTTLLAECRRQGLAVREDTEREAIVRVDAGGHA
jgi:hypothetical protein